ncbi:hypothetical protein BaRGS_00017770 [Batillaria attramentaria]|uniref:BLOC-2 complex member HPS3 N-terminal domain-containing protein n=1 Tax=Batillaria attramentaria TaxID=370345 RepID=A0ABD0KUD8_9CAEN
MVRVFRCHNFKRSTVVPVTDEPLAVFSDGDLVFVATRQCSIRVYKPNEDGSGFSEWRCLSTICAVEKMAYNRHKDYIITLEQKRSWKSVSRYVRVYINWQVEVPKTAKQRTKVRIAGKAHSLHSSSSYVPQLEVVELPVDGTVTAIGVCKLTGNFAIAFGREVKLYHIVEKTVANSDRTYQDVEPFLELCWNFDVRSVSLSEEFLVCCSHNEVQAIAISYAEADDASPRNRRVSSPRPQSSQHLMFSLDDIPAESPSPDVGSHRSVSPASTGQSTGASSCTQLSFTPRVNTPRAIVDDEYYQEWSFDPDDDLLEAADDAVRNQSKSKVIFLHSLHRGSPHAQHQAAPPVLRDFRGGPVKSSSGVSARTVLYLSDLREQDDWLSVTLVPSHLPEPDSVQGSAVTWSGTNPVKSAFLPCRCSVCCFVSSRRGGYLYRLTPGSTLVSSYRYTDAAHKVVAGPHLLQVVTRTGIETYTGRWGAVALAVTEEGEEVRPASSLDICLCGIEPFIGAVDISHGTNIALLTKVEAQKGQDDLLWNLYVLENCSVADLYKDLVRGE